MCEKSKMAKLWDYVDFKRSLNLVRVDNDHCQKYTQKQGTPEKQILLTLTVPYEILYEWQKARLKLQVPYSFNQILNDILAEKTGNSMNVDSRRLEDRLRKVCSEVANKFVGKRGRVYQKLKQKEMKLAIQLYDLKTSGHEEKNRDTIENLLDDKKILSDRCDLLTRENILAKAAVTKTHEELSKRNLENEELNLENQELHQYIERELEALNFENSSAKMTDVGNRQQRRKLKELKTKVEKALWFTKTFGLELDSVKFKDKDGVERDLTYMENKACAYKDLSPEDQQKVCINLNLTGP